MKGNPMGHVPDENLPQYRRLKAIYDHFETAGDYLGSQYPEDANKAYALAGKYKAIAQELRVQP